MKRLILPLILLALPVLQDCANVLQEQTAAQGTDPTLSSSTYYEEGSLVFLAVDSRAASLSDHETIFPLALMLVNKTNKGIRLTFEDFTLVDSEGSSYPLESYETFRRTYRRVAVDQKLSEHFIEITNHHLSLDGSMLSPYRSQGLPFYGQGTLREDAMELGPKQYIRGFLYFPIPQDGLKDKLFELHIASRDLQHSVFVRFRVR